jgi:Tfp pilus assembly protein PilO
MARKTVLRRKDIIIASCLGVLDIAIVVSVQLLLIAPEISRAEQERTRLAGVVKELEENNKKRRTLIEVEEQNKKLASQIARFDRRIAAKSGTVTLFADVLRIAGQNSLKILGTQPLEPLPVGQGLLRAPYEISVQGSFSDLGRFISSLETHTNFVDVVKADVTGQPDGPVRMKMVLNLYAAAGQTEDESAPAAPAAKSDPTKKR